MLPPTTCHCRPALAGVTATAIIMMNATAAAQFCPGGYPQADLPLECEMGVATCFSDFVVPGNPFSGINPQGFVVAVVDFRDPATNAPGTGQHWCAPMLHNEFPVTADTWNAENLGQVFGIALDDDNPPNIYVTATTTYGSDEPSYQNGNTTAFGSSPFGPGGAGAVYRLNGSTGAISVFAMLPNSGPGLGNICFDATVDMFYVTNFEDGRIYRLSTAGTCLSTFDHATDVIGGCAPEAGDPDGFVPLRERIWGLNVFEGRVYYGVWVEDRGRPGAGVQNEVWSVAIDGAGEFVAGSLQLEIMIPSMPGVDWSNPVSDIAFSSARRMMIAERNMRADVGPGARFASGLDGHRSRDLEYELDGGGNWVPSGRDFFIGTSSSGPGTNASGGIGYDCGDNLWSTGDQVLISGNPILAVYGLQWTPEPGNTLATIASTGYFIDLDGISTVQTKNRIGDVEVYNGCCDCMTVNVTSISCDYDDEGLTGKYTVTAEITNDSGTTAQYVLLPNVETQPHIIVLDPPLPSGTGEVRTITFQLCDLPPGTMHCFDLVLADEFVEACCAVEVCVDLPECDCLEFTEVSVVCDANGDLTVNIGFANLSGDVIEHVFLFKPLPPDPNAGITIVPDYFDLTGSPVAPWSTGSIGPITISGAIPGTELCLLVSVHDADLIECCSEELCFEVPECDPTVLVGACCLPDGTCVAISAAECEAAMGLYLGDGVPCSECGGLTPIGACCRADGSCIQVSVFECGLLQGIYLGDDVPCVECELVSPIGACCLADGTCVQTSAIGCEMSGGVYVGDGTPCSDCPGGFSPCDFDQDGSVGFSDLTTLLASWGPCPGCPADVDGDGVVGFADLVALLAQWG